MTEILMKMWDIDSDNLWSSKTYWLDETYYCYGDGWGAEDVPFFFKLLDLV